MVDPGTDGDLDGMTLFGEFAFGMNPTRGGGSPVQRTWTTESAGQRWVYLEFTRHILAAQMVDFEVQGTATLNGWQDVTSGTEEVPPLRNLDGSVELVTLRYPVPQTSNDGYFLRVRASPK